MNKTVAKKLTITLLCFIFAIVWGELIGCSKIDDDEVDDTSEVSVNSISLSTTNAFVKSDNSDSVTLSAMALDENNGVISNVAIQFSATGGVLGASSVLTDESGIAETTFSSGNLDPSNQTVSVTASASKVNSVMLPIQIVGTNLSISAGSSLQIGGDDSDTLTVKVLDAGDNPIHNATVTFSLEASSTGDVNFSNSTATTDINGEASVDVTATSIGDAVVRATAKGTYLTHNYVVKSLSDSFYISSPSSELVTQASNVTRVITVNAPDQDTVRFATTLGEFQDPADSTWKSVVNITVSSSTASATFRSLNSGFANIQVYDQDDISTNDSVRIAVSAPTEDAYQIIIQASATNIAPSVGDLENSITLTATVKTDDDEPVGNAAVVFSVLNPTGGGEYMSPTVALTNYLGVANSVFTSGSLSSGGNGVTIAAKVINSDGSTTISDDIAIVIGGTAGSILITVSTEAASINEDTLYQLPVSVMVADSNGNPISGAQVSLATWPKSYHTGYWVKDGSDWVPVITATLDNEDINKNTILDAGEDGGEYIGLCSAVVDVAVAGDPFESCAIEDGVCQVYNADSVNITGFDGISCSYDYIADTYLVHYYGTCSQIINLDGQLTPGNSAAGTVPSSVMTDSNGVGTFYLVYPKASAVWITDEFVASTRVLGTETRSSKLIQLPYLEDDAESLENSPYNDDLF